MSTYMVSELIAAHEKESVSASEDYLELEMSRELEKEIAKKKVALKPKSKTTTKPSAKRAKALRKKAALDTLWKGTTIPGCG